MNKPVRLLLLTATLLPFVYMMFFFAIILMSVLSASSAAGTQREPGLPINFALLFVLHLFIMLWGMALMVFYIVHAFRSQQLDKDKKLLWIIIIFMGNMIAMPIYWYFYIWQIDSRNSSMRSFD